MSLETRIDSIGRQIKILADRLEERGFEFDHEARVFPGPESEMNAAIARIEREIGELPLALKLFWQRVGSVNFCGSHPDWMIHMGSEPEAYPDPLVVYPPSVAILELEEFLTDKEERLKCNLPYVVPIAPDFYHKADVSGGMFYNISVPAIADDPPLNDERHQTTFLNYLEIATKRGGFPGLDRCPGHTWPIARLIEGI